MAKVRIPEEERVANLFEELIEGLAKAGEMHLFAKHGWIEDFRVAIDALKHKCPSVVEKDLLFEFYKGYYDGVQSLVRAKNVTTSG